MTWETMEAHAGDMTRMMRGIARFIWLFNIAGVPTLSLPGGFSVVGSHIIRPLSMVCDIQGQIFTCDRDRGSPAMRRVFGERG